MHKQKSATISREQLWHNFITDEQLTNEQAEQFQRYTDLLLAWNEKTNLTRITSLKDVVAHHYRDALQLGRFVDMNSINSVCDVGTGGGIPGIPLKIKYPHLHVYLIEVSGKKRAFLHDVIDQLGLTGITIIDLDWRTFLRKTDEQIDLFVSRASLPVEELTRAFKPSSPYKNSTIIYWASVLWEPTAKEKPYVFHDEEYRLGYKTRRYIFLKNPAIGV